MEFKKGKCIKQVRSKKKPVFSLFSELIASFKIHYTAHKVWSLPGKMHYAPIFSQL